MSNNVPPIPQNKIEETHVWRDWFARLRDTVNAGTTVTVTSSSSSSSGSGGGSTPYTLPVATNTILGGVKQGSGVTIAGDGTLSTTGGGTVTSVTGTAPIASSGGTTPAISIATASGSTAGALSSADWTTFNNKQPAGSYQATLVSGTSIKTVNSTTLLGSGDVAVQATLVSGTNIKTINGSSLLGSGDIATASYIKESTTVSTTDTIPNGYQELVYGTYTLDGTIDLQGKLVLL